MNESDKLMRDVVKAINTFAGTEYTKRHLELVLADMKVAVDKVDLAKQWQDLAKKMKEKKEAVGSGTAKSKKTDELLSNCEAIISANVSLLVADGISNPTKMEDLNHLGQHLARYAFSPGPREGKDKTFSAIAAGLTDAFQAKTVKKKAPSKKRR